MTVAITLISVVALEESVVPGRGPGREAEYEWCGFAKQQRCSRLKKGSQNNGHSSYKCGSLAELRVASDADNFFLEGTSASESYFA